MFARTAQVAAALAAAVLAIVLTGPLPASAAGELGLSSDGVTWSGDGLTTPLFDPATLWVPGDVRESTFYVRNQAREPGLLTIDLRGAAVDSLLETGDLVVETRVGDGPWVATSATGTQRLSAADVTPGGVRPVTVRVSFGFESPNSSQVTQLQMDFLVALTQSGATVVDPGLLPSTGLRWGTTTLAIALAATLAGSVLLARREREVA